MDREFSRSIEIAAPIEEVWAALADLEGWAAWAGAHAHGELRPGERITIRWDPPGSLFSYRARPRVGVVEPPHRLELAGTVLASRVLSGERRYELERLEPRLTRFTNTARLSGLRPLVGPIADRIESLSLQFNQRLKARVEGER